MTKVNLQTAFKVGDTVAYSNPVNNLWSIQGRVVRYYNDRIVIRTENGQEWALKPDSLSQKREVDCNV